MNAVEDNPHVENGLVYSGLFLDLIIPNFQNR